MNIGEFHTIGGNLSLTLTNSKDPRISSFYKRDGNPGISFDLFTGYTPGIKLKIGETMKFTIKIDPYTFSQGLDSQRTSIFFAKYKISNQNELISGTTPLRIAYDICDEGVSRVDNSTPVIFNEYFQMKNLGFDYQAYQNDIQGKVIELSTTYTDWLKGKYLSNLIEAYESKKLVGV